MFFPNACFITGTAYAGKSTMVLQPADPEVSVNRFFNRPGKEKQFLYRLMMEEPDPQASCEFPGVPFPDQLPGKLRSIQKQRLPRHSS